MSSLERLRSLYRSEKSLDIKFIPWLPSDIETSNEFAWVDSSVPSFLSINSRNCRRLISLDSVRAMSIWLYNETFHQFLFSYFSFRDHPGLLSIFDGKLRDDITELETLIVRLYNTILSEDFANQFLDKFQSASFSASVLVSNKSEDSVSDPYVDCISCIKSLSPVFIIQLSSLFFESNSQMFLNLWVRSFQIRKGFRRDLSRCCAEMKLTVLDLVSNYEKQNNFKQSSIVGHSNARKSSTGSAHVSRPLKVLAQSPRSDPLISKKDALFFAFDIVASLTALLDVLCQLKFEENDASCSFLYRSDGSLGLTESGLAIIETFDILYSVLFGQMLMSVSSTSMEDMNLKKTCKNAILWMILRIHSSMKNFIRSLLNFELNLVSNLAMNESSSLPLNIFEHEPYLFSTFVENILSNQLLTSGHPMHESSQHLSLVGDMSALFKEELSQIFELEVGEKSEYLMSLCDHLSERLSVVQNLFRTFRNGDDMPSSLSTSIPTVMPISSTTTTTTSQDKSITNAKKEAFQNSKVDEDKDLVLLQDIFPDCGKAFLLACYRVYSKDVSVCIDAISSNNLDPALISMDRKAESVQIGKASLKNVAFSKPSREEIRRVIEIERRQQEDADLVNRMLLEDESKFESHYRPQFRYHDDNFDDDFDDQIMDDLTIMKPSSGSTDDLMSSIQDSVVSEMEMDEESSSRSTNKRRVNRSKSSKSNDNQSNRNETHLDWDARIRDTKRYNNMIRAEETEIAYWKSLEVMKNKKNVDITLDANDDMEEDDERNQEGKHKATTSRDSRKLNENTSKNQPVKNVNDKKALNGFVNKNGKSEQNQSSEKNASHRTSNSSSENGEMDSKKKYRTKTFDKHHAKDKAFRKQSLSLLS